MFEASVFNKESLCKTEQREVRNEIQAGLPKPAWAHRDNGVATAPSSRTVDRVPWGNQVGRML